MRFRKTSNKYYPPTLIIVICFVLGRVAIALLIAELLIEANKIFQC